jgi:PAS domain S-box-containing protein
VKNPDFKKNLVDNEKGFKILVQGVMDYGIFMLDPEGYIATWNEGAYRTKGYTASEIIGKHFSIFYPEEDKAWDKPGWELKVATAEGRIEDEAWRVRKDGTRFWANVIITALYDENKKLIGFGKVTRDLTERILAQHKAVADAKKIAEAEAASRAKSEFLTTMSHELRTPLNAIGGYAELLSLGVVGPITTEMKEYIDRILNSQKHLLRIINDLLNLGQIEAGKITYQKEPVSLPATINSVYQMIEPQAASRHQKLERPVCPPDLVVCADGAKLGQILLNLLSNAVKYTQNGSTISLHCTRKGDIAEVTVTDNGPGIPENMREAIFEPFVQVGRSLTNVREGSGLGLAISREIAEAMEGTLTMEPVNSGGARFTLMLPVYDAAAKK